MKPLLLSFSAFGPYAGKETLDFGDLRDRSFFLIHGPTGAGKTTILDAICFALYGDSSGNLRDGRTMRSDHAGLVVATEVDFTFAVGTQSYRVWRSPEQERPKKRGEGVTVSLADAALYEWKPDGEKILAHGYSNVTAKVEALLGFRSSQFRQVVLLPQGEFRRLLLANSAERQEIMQTLFKTDVYREIEETLKQRAKVVERERGECAEKLRYVLTEQGVESAAALEAEIAKKEEARRALAVRVEELRLAQEQAQKAAADGKVLAGKFAAREKAAEEDAACKALVPEVEKFRLVYGNAQRAAQLADIEKQCGDLADDAKEGAAKAEDFAKQAAALEAQAAVAAENCTAEEAKSAAREAADKEALELAGYEEKLALFAAARAAARTKEKEAADSAKQQQALEDVWMRLKEALQQAQTSVQSQALLAAQRGAKQAALEQAKRLAEKLTERDQLAAEAVKAEAAYKEAEAAFGQSEAACEAAQKHALRLQHLFAEGQAAILALDLTEGAPCPVCGATVHPRPAVSGAVLPSEPEIKAAQAALAEADKQRRAAQDRMSESKTRLDTLRGRQQDAAAALEGCAEDAAALRTRIGGLEKETRAARQAETDLPAAEENLRKLQSEEEACAARAARLQAAHQAAESGWKAAEAVAMERGAALPEVYRDKDALTAARQAAEALRQKLKAALESARQAAQQRKKDAAVAAANAQAARENLEKTRLRSAAKRTEFLARLAEAGFAEEALYAEAKKDEAYRRRLEERIRLFDERINKARHALEHAARETQGLAQPDVAALEARFAATLAQYNQAFADRQQLDAALVRQKEKRGEAAALAKRLARLDETYGTVGTLAEVANGKNAHGMTFQRFVLKSLLDDVIDASNLRLKIMSRGQYMLQGTDERARKNAAGGLELEVFDHYTGCARPVATLSGGETFLASLALALGLADVVQSYAGGIHLDTILVDEGFGTLDPEALDIAIRTLIDLQKGGRLVGIISHVPELKERIDARLEVIKGKNGSTARFCVG